MEEDKILHGILLKKAKEAQYTNYEIEQLNLQSESLFIRYFLEREAAKIVENTNIEENVLKKIYEENQTLYKFPKKVKIDTIFVKDLAKAEEILKEVNLENFNELKDKNDEKRNEVISNLRKFVLNSMINGKIKFYCSENEVVPYEENKVYIPEKFRNYLKTLIIGEGAGVVGIANSRNELINDLNDVDVIVADILSEPKTEKEIIEELSKTTIYRTMPDGERKEVEASEYLPESIRKFEFLGYFSKR